MRRVANNIVQSCTGSPRRGEHTLTIQTSYFLLMPCWQETSYRKGEYAFALKTKERNQISVKTCFSFVKSVRTPLVRT